MTSYFVYPYISPIYPLYIPIYPLYTPKYPLYIPVYPLYAAAVTNVIQFAACPAIAQQVQQVSEQCNRSKGLLTPALQCNSATGTQTVQTSVANFKYLLNISC